MNIKVSVIIPVYNVEKYIRRCLNSVINQSLQEIEIICVNDCSTDCSREIISEYAAIDTRILIKNLSGNSGLSIARNTGLRMAHGEYIFLLDSDDYIEVDALRYLYSKATAKKSDIIFFEFHNIYENQKISEMLNGKYEREVYFSEGNWEGSEGFCQLVTAGMIPRVACGQMYKKSFLEKNNIHFIPHIFHEDLPFVVHASLLASNISYTDKKVYNWFHREESITTTNISIEHIEGRVAGIQYVLELWKNGNWDKPVEESIEKVIQKLIIDLEISTNKIDDVSKIFKNNLYNQAIAQILVSKFDYMDINKKIQKEIIGAKQIIVFGAGAYASRFIKMLNDWNIMIQAVMQTNTPEKEKYIYGHKVIGIEQYCGDKENELVVVASSPRLYEDIDKTLKENSFSKIIHIFS